MNLPIESIGKKATQAMMARRKCPVCGYSGGATGYTIDGEGGYDAAPCHFPGPGEERPRASWPTGYPLINPKRAMLSKAASADVSKTLRRASEQQAEKLEAEAEANEAQADADRQKADAARMKEGWAEGEKGRKEWKAWFDQQSEEFKSKWEEMNEKYGDVVKSQYKAAAAPPQRLKRVVPKGYQIWYTIDRKDQGWSDRPLNDPNPYISDVPNIQTAMSRAKEIAEMSGVSTVVIYDSMGNQFKVMKLKGRRMSALYKASNCGCACGGNCSCGKGLLPIERHMAAGSVPEELKENEWTDADGDNPPPKPKADADGDGKTNEPKPDFLKGKKASGPLVTYVFRSPVEYNKAKRVLNTAMLPVEFGAEEIEVHPDDVEDVEFALQDSRVEFAKRKASKSFPSSHYHDWSLIGSGSTAKSGPWGLVRDDGKMVFVELVPNLGYKITLDGKIVGYRYPQQEAFKVGEAKDPHRVAMLRKAFVPERGWVKWEDSKKAVRIIDIELEGHMPLVRLPTGSILQAVGETKSIKKRQDGKWDFFLDPAEKLVKNPGLRGVDEGKTTRGIEPFGGTTWMVVHMGAPRPSGRYGNDITLPVEEASTRRRG